MSVHPLTRICPGTSGASRSNPKQAILDLEKSGNKCNGLTEGDSNEPDYSVRTEKWSVLYPETRGRNNGPWKCQQGGNRWPLSSGHISVDILNFLRKREFRSRRPRMCGTWPAAASTDWWKRIMSNDGTSEWRWLTTAIWINYLKILWAYVLSKTMIIIGITSYINSAVLFTRPWSIYIYYIVIDKQYYYCYYEIILYKHDNRLSVFSANCRLSAFGSRELVNLRL